MAGTSLFCFDALDEIEEVEGKRPEVTASSLDGEWECLCDYHRTGRLVELFMHIDGRNGHYSVNGNAHRLADIIVSPGKNGTGISATFRWVNRNGSAGKGKWKVDKAGRCLEGSWTLDGDPAGPWSWSGHRKPPAWSLKNVANVGYAGGGFATRQSSDSKLDGAWDCSCDYNRTGRPIAFEMTIKGSEGCYHVEGGIHKLSEVEVHREDGAVTVSFRWSTRRQDWSCYGSGKWTLTANGDGLEGGWMQDNVEGGPWSWKCKRRSSQPVVAPPRLQKERYVLNLEGFVGDIADPALDDLDALRSAYASLRVGRDRTVWDEDKLAELPGVENVRAGEYNMFVWQTYEDEDCQAAADALLAAGAKPYFDKTKEDGGEGVLAVSVKTATGSDMLVSRDLLDSVSEMMFLERHGILQRDEDAVVMDIGAGYGRLARRMTEVFPNVRYYATDGIPESTYSSHKYLSKHRSRAQVVPLTKVGLLVSARPKLAINVHSFSEQSEEDVAFWVHLMAQAKTRYFFIVPNSSTKHIMFFNGRRAPLNPILEKAGYRLECIGSHFGMGRCQDKYFLWVLQSDP